MNKVSAYITLLTGLCLLFGAPVVVHAELEMADHLVVHKSERKLKVMRGDRVLRAMDIALGLVPTGHKRHEGDYRTPEGAYRLSERNPASDFFLSIRISYPNDEDEHRARRRGQSPGGQIMIHGQPNDPKYSSEYYRSADWTNGCIAVSNSDMIDIWLMTPDDTPIEIRP
jgi:murein L,D-transpeptidase YafK